MNNDDVARAACAARRYREMGYSPLPSKLTDKKPSLFSYSEYQSRPLEDSFFEGANWGTSNVQLMCGKNSYGPSKLIVVDCDGEPAVKKFTEICDQKGLDLRDTWRVKTGGGGIHVYFACNKSPVKSGMIWGLWDTWGKGQWAKHQEIRILGDSSLVIAPPSLHIKTKIRYKFHESDPIRSPRPIEAPEWLLVLPRISAPRITSSQNHSKTSVFLKSPTRPYSGPVRSREEILSAIPDKAALVASWGLSFASQHPNASGWLSCYAAGREDRHPSASFHSASGIYQDRTDSLTISLFDLGVILQPQVFADWRDCKNWCASQYCESPYTQALALHAYAYMPASKSESHPPAN